MNTYDCVKRCLDVTLATLLLVATLPIQLVVAALVLRFLGRPVLFRQQRPGRDGALFTILKFRSMRPQSDSRFVESDDDRMDSFGRLLRSSSLDELPTLINVIKGDMSFVGPRPLLSSYLPLYSEFQRRRHEVRPGVTGLAQVSGRNHLSWESKFSFDVEYVDSRSFILDAKILLRTVGSVLKREGITDTNGDPVVPFDEIRATSAESQTLKSLDTKDLL